MLGNIEGLNGYDRPVTDGMRVSQYTLPEEVSVAMKERFWIQRAAHIIYVCLAGMRES